MGEHALVLITCGEREEARAISRRLVSDGAAAGVQMLPIDSVYRWQGEVVEDEEWLLIAKTRSDRFESVAAVVEELHSYEVPPLLMIGMDDASRPYLEWIDQSTG
jgi:periplasmic divalent cation tolerance protein